jgi:hypothetical protein
MLFLEEEMVILNHLVSNGIPHRIGERALIIEYLLDSVNYDYLIEFDDSTIGKVKEIELNKLTTSDIKYMEYIFTGNEVIYKPADKTAKILKCDYIHQQAEIEFVSGGTDVVEFDKLKEKEINIVPEFKFKDGDKVKAHTRDRFDGLVGVVERGFLAGKVKGYDVVFGDETGSFDESELELFEIEEVKQDSPRVELHRNVIEEIHQVFKVKNSDYGNSFGEQYEEHGLLSAIIRLDDKMRRLKQLNKQQAQVKDESIRDTLLDLSNYAIMTVMELDK